MTKKLYEKCQEPKIKFVTDWVWKILALTGVGFLSYAQLWGDQRYVTRLELPNQLTRFMTEHVEPRLILLERHVTDSNLHPSTTLSDDRYVTRREFNLILDVLTEIKQELQRIR